MITAKEARQRVSNIQSSNNNAQLESCEKSIMKSIENGNLSSTVAFWVNDYIKNHLEDNGYVVERYTERNESCTSINWSLFLSGD